MCDASLSLWCLLSPEEGSRLTHWYLSSHPNTPSGDREKPIWPATVGTVTAWTDDGVLLSTCTVFMRSGSVQFIQRYPQ